MERDGGKGRRSVPCWVNGLMLLNHGQDYGWSGLGIVVVVWVF